jgi:cytochrome c oxidase subunit II
MQQSTARPFASLGFLIAGVAAAVVLATSGPAWVTCEHAGAERVAASLRVVAPVHLAVLAVCALLATAVCGLLLYSIVTARAAGSAPEELRVQRRNPREVLWALVPVAIVIAASLPAIFAFQRLADGAAPVPAGIDAGYVCRLSQ